MKNAGILTFHNSNHNFGAVLQTFALYTVVKQLGYNAHVINYQTQQLSLKEKIFALKVRILGFRFNKFRKEHIKNILPLSNSEKKLKELNKKLDVFIVGSDQVWRYTSKHQHLKRYFFDFVGDDKNLISYAPSFGLDSWDGPESLRADIETLIARFSAVSVREESGVAICREKFNREASCVLDPTLLLNQADYEDILSGCRYKSRKEFLAYMILDDSSGIKEFFRETAKKRRLDFIEIKGRSYKILKKQPVFHSVARWLYYMKDSDLVVTDSFHCVAFSIIFRKDFICLVNKKRGVSRLQNLLGLLNLEDRLFFDFEQINDAILGKHIDYIDVEKRLEPEKEKSLEFLRSALNAG